MPPLEPEGGVGGLVLSVPFGYGYAVNEVISVPRACRRAFSCFICTARKCCSSSCHLMSSRASLERVEERLPTVLVSSEDPSEPCVEGTKWRNVRFGRNVQEAGRVDGIQAVAEGEEGGALWQ